MLDKRLHLKIKIKNLAEEARIIRSEERKVRGRDRWELQHHRKTVVRDEARRSQIAYAIIRGKDPSVHWSFDLTKRLQDKPHVERMVKKYGSSISVARLEEYSEAA